MQMEIKRKSSEWRMNVCKAKEVEYLTFPILNRTGIVRHMFSTRMGGVSKGIYSSMNLSFQRGDSEEAVNENYRRIAKTLGCHISDIVCSAQTHTVNIRIADDADRGKGIIYEKDYTDIDGLITNVKGIVLATFYADCVPLFFVDTKRKAIGLAHSGWRGTIGRMGLHMIEAMGKEYGTRPEDVTAAIGPSICKDCYEVSADVAEKFMKEFHKSVQSEKILYDKGSGKYMLDLWKANEIILLEAGILPEKLQITDICTCCNPEYLFSHRASHGKRGNSGAFLGLL